MEYFTETLRNKFFTYAKSNKLEWVFNHKKSKVKVKADINSSDRLARHPVYTLLEIFRNSLPPKEQGPGGQLQGYINFVQIWLCKDAPTTSLLAQAGYTLTSDCIGHLHYLPIPR